MSDVPETPLYALRDVRTLVLKGQFQLATQKCRSQSRGLGLTKSDVGKLLCQLQTQHFLSVYGLAECDFGTYPADDYLAWIDVDNIAIVDPGEGVKVYIKFAVALTPANGEQVLAVSFHKAER